MRQAEISLFYCDEKSKPMTFGLLSNACSLFILFLFYKKIALPVSLIETHPSVPAPISVPVSTVILYFMANVLECISILMMLITVLKS